MHYAEDYGTNTALPRATSVRQFNEREALFLLRAFGKEVSCIPLDEPGFEKIPKYNDLNFYISFSHGTIDMSASISRNSEITFYLEMYSDFSC